MKNYIVENAASGVVFGVYRAEDPDAAIRAMLEDAKVPEGTTPSPDLIATEIPDTRPAPFGEAGA